MIHKVSNFEFRFSILFYLSLTGYAVYELFLAKDEILKKAETGFAPGWKIIGGQKDVAGLEWNMLLLFLQSYYIYYIIHSVSSELCRCYAPELISKCHALVGGSFLLLSYNPLILILTLFKIASFYYATLYTRKIWGIWLTAAFWQTVIILIQYEYILNYFNQVEYYVLLIMSAWNILRALSFSIDKVKAKNNETEDVYSLMDFCGYILYFPTLVNAPIIIYERYKCCLTVSRDDMPPLKYRIVKLSLNLIRIGFWIAFKEAALHYCYVYYLQRRIEAIQQLNPWALYGLAYLMLFYFYINYVISYGLGGEFAKFDGVNAPNQPKCIATVHFYSDMWREFDVGLYDFLFKYIYCSLCEKTSPQHKKVIANFLTFAFVYVWHGIEDYILIWTAINFVTSYVEKIYRTILRSALFESLVGPYFDNDDQTQLYRLCTAQLYLPASIANFYFFAGTDVGHYYMYTTYYGGILSYLYLTAWSSSFVNCAEYFYKEKRPKKLEALSLNDIQEEMDKTD